MSSARSPFRPSSAPRRHVRSPRVLSPLLLLLLLPAATVACSSGGGSGGGFADHLRAFDSAARDVAAGITTSYRHLTEINSKIASDIIMNPVRPLTVVGLLIKDRVGNALQSNLQVLTATKDCDNEGYDNEGCVLGIDETDVNGQVTVPAGELLIAISGPDVARVTADDVHAPAGQTAELVREPIPIDGATPEAVAANDQGLYEPPAGGTDAGGAGTTDTGGGGLLPECSHTGTVTGTMVHYGITVTIRAQGLAIEDFRVPVARAVVGGVRDAVAVAVGWRRVGREADAAPDVAARRDGARGAAGLVAGARRAVVEHRLGERGEHARGVQDVQVVPVLEPAALVGEPAEQPLLDVVREVLAAGGFVGGLGAMPAAGVRVDADEDVRAPRVRVGRRVAEILVDAHVVPRRPQDVGREVGHDERVLRLVAPSCSGSGGSATD